MLLGVAASLVLAASALPLDHEEDGGEAVELELEVDDDEDRVAGAESGSDS